MVGLLLLGLFIVGLFVLVWQVTRKVAPDPCRENFTDAYDGSCVMRVARHACLWYGRNPQVGPRRGGASPVAPPQGV